VTPSNNRPNQPDDRPIAKDEGVVPEQGASEESATGKPAPEESLDYGDFQDEAAQAADADASPVSSLATELAEASDRILRLQAEMENVRKRAARDIGAERQYGSMNLMRDLLPVLDNMHRAIEVAEQAHDASGLLAGFKMVASMLCDVLARHHCTRMEALYQQFDPHLHEAVAQYPSEEHPAGTIVIETQSGWQLHDRIVRPAQVIVSTGPAAGAADEGEGRSDESET